MYGNGNTRSCLSNMKGSEYQYNEIYFKFNPVLVNKQSVNCKDLILATCISNIEINPPHLSIFNVKPKTIVRLHNIIISHPF